jgi:hypothetical protein
MSEIDIERLVKQMRGAALNVLKEKYPPIKTYAETEFKKFGETVLMIQQAKLAGEIDQEDARILLEMQKNAMRSVMLTAEGLGGIVVEKAINASLRAVREIINSGIGWKLI